MDRLERIFQEARRRNVRVVLPEGHDPRIAAAASRLQSERLARPILLGGPEHIAAAAAAAGVDLAGIEQRDPSDNPRLEAYVAAYSASRRLVAGVSSASRCSTPG